MGVPIQREDPGFKVRLGELGKELACLDLTRTEHLGDRVLQLIASQVCTDRVSLLIFDQRTNSVKKAFAVGLEPATIDWNEHSLVLDHVRQAGTKLLVYDIHEYSKLISDRVKSYRTDAFAVFPLVIGRKIIAFLCISNLSTQQVMQIENSGEMLNLVLSQITQIAKLLAEHQRKPLRKRSQAPDELAVLCSLIETLDQSMDTRNIFTIFNEIISDYIHLDMLAIIHDGFHEPQQGIICVHKPVHWRELQAAFNDIATQWQRRHRRAPLMDITDARVFGKDLVKQEGDCPVELLLESTEVFPVLIDNDLFGLVCIATDEATLADQRRMKMFNVLAHHLLLHLKKSLLLVQNQEMQTVDSLTGLYNERHFYEMMDREFDRASRYNVPISVLFVDVDHFKDVNESYGFETGDLLLKDISRIIVENMRTTDFCSRYSGERFVIVLPETHYKNAEIMANRLRRFIENHSFFIANTNVFIKVTVSIGVASYLDHKPASLAQFIEFADTALYFAKRNGRNQVVGYSYVINMMIGDTDHES